MNKIQTLKDLKTQVIQFRKSLDISQNISFGVEIEYENVLQDIITDKISELRKKNSNFKEWKNSIDITNLSTLNKNYINGEIKSPIMFDNEESWDNLKTILEMIKQENGMISNRCGGHVNIGAQILENNKDYLVNFLLLWKLYNEEIIKFSSGEFKKIRNSNYIRPISSDLFIKDILKEEKNLKEYLKHLPRSLFDKCHDISLKKVTSSKFKNNNVIEFRIPNGTLDINIWQNYVNFFVKFLLASKKELDIDKIIYKIKNNSHDVFELADFVFENEIDKDNFLIQTLKTNKIYKKSIPKHIKSY